MLLQALDAFGVRPALIAPAGYAAFVRDGAFVATTLLCAVQTINAPRHRTSIGLLTGALSAFTAANVYMAISAGLGGLAAPPRLLSDLLWLGFYPPIFAAMLMLLAVRLPRVGLGVALDALIAALAVVTVGVRVIIEPVLAALSGHPDGPVNTAFPIGDITVLALIGSVLTIHGWRGSSGWRLMALGLAVFTGGDALYAKQIASGSYRPGSSQDLIWTVGLVLMAYAAGRVTASEPSPRKPGWLTLALPVGGLVAGTGVLLFAAFSRLSALTIWFAAAGILVSIARVAVMIRDLRRLADSAREARTDALTGLPNRRGFFEVLDRTGHDGERFAVLVADVDAFKEINDTLGHFTGDRVLQEVGHRLQEALGRETVVARLGGDEFAAIIHGDARHAASAGGLLTETMREPLQTQGIDLALRISAGIALYPEHGTGGETLFQHADIAMYRAKSQRRGFALYEPGQDLHTPDRLKLVADLQRALETGQLLLHYQPKVDARTRRLRGVEALVRWQHPDRGLIPPVEFIPVAERTGLILPLTERVLTMALDQLAAWRREGLVTEVAVNIPEALLLDDTLASRLDEQLRARRLPASALRLELTETAVMSDPARVRQVIHKLHRLGIGVSLDDFGTGYSSLAQLRHLLADELKIDKSFVLAMEGDRDSEAIVELAIELGLRLGLDVVAEGVETDAAWTTLAGLGCGVLQGFAISRPLPPDDLAAWVTEWRAAGAQAEALEAGLPPAPFVARTAAR